jgi:hypothetical protein
LPLTRRILALLPPACSALVAEVMLFSEGFEDSKVLSRKMVQLYKLASEQLSQQVSDHEAPSPHRVD